MAKDKAKTGVPNKHLHARISYLQQASTYLTAQASKHSASAGAAANPRGKTARANDDQAATMGDDARGLPSFSYEQHASGGLPQRLADHLTQVARKSQIRLHPSIKHSICKRCDSVLIDGETSTRSIENLSKDGRKPHADVLLILCSRCGKQRRFPVGARRQRKKLQRKSRAGKLAPAGDGTQQELQKRNS